MNRKKIAALLILGSAVFVFVQPGTGIGEKLAQAGEKVGKLLTRGLRNNNPGNIRISGAAWRGKIVPNTDGSFEQFDTPENGIRAMTRILQNYYGRGLVTVRQIISTWAPANENNTAAYVSSVANDMGVTPDSALQFPEHLPALVSAIIKHENGVNPYTVATISNGVSAA